MKHGTTARLRRATSLVLVTAAPILSFSCGETVSGTDSSSHWLSPCKSSADCAANEACVNGFCSVRAVRPDAGSGGATSNGGTGGKGTGGSGGGAGRTPADGQVGTGGFPEGDAGDAGSLTLESCAASPTDPTCSGTPRLTFSTPVVRGPGDSGTFAPGDPMTVSFTVTNDDPVTGYAYPCFGLAADHGVVGVKPDVSIYSIIPNATIPYSFTVQLPSSLAPGTLVHFTAYVASLHVRCATWPKIDFSITVGPRASTGVCEPPDASPALPCRGTSTSTLPGVTARLLPTRCSYTSQEAVAGIDVDYDVRVAAPVSGVIPTPLDLGGCDKPSASGLIPLLEVTGGGREYCVCDVGLCPPPSKTPVDLKRGCYPGSVHFEGVDWFGPSDTGNSKGAAFPPGDYVVELRHAGKLAGDGGAPFEVDASFVVTITP